VVTTKTKQYLEYGSLTKTGKSLSLSYQQDREKEEFIDAD
jgi:hypothetical protein